MDTYDCIAQLYLLESDACAACLNDDIQDLSRDAAGLGGKGA